MRFEPARAFDLPWRSASWGGGHTRILRADGRRHAHWWVGARRGPAPPTKRSPRGSQSRLLTDPSTVNGGRRGRVAPSTTHELDEPTVAMDVESRHEFWNSMRTFAAHGKTVVFATHCLEEADQNADRVVLLAHGRIVADGPPTEVKAPVQPGLLMTSRSPTSWASSPRRCPCCASQAPLRRSARTAATTRSTTKLSIRAKPDVALRAC